MVRPFIYQTLTYRFRAMLFRRFRAMLFRVITSAAQELCDGFHTVSFNILFILKNTKTPITSLCHFLWYNQVQTSARKIAMAWWWEWVLQPILVALPTQGCAKQSTITIFKQGRNTAMSWLPSLVSYLIDKNRLYPNIRQSRFRRCVSKLLDYLNTT